jgi:hypothetical protein
MRPCGEVDIVVVLLRPTLLAKVKFPILLVAEDELLVRVLECRMHGNRKF